MSDELKHWIADRARELRTQQTPQEQQLWQELRAKRFSGFKFRRQEPIGRYIADFVCFRARLVIELDGGQHGENRAHDENRDAWLREQGFRVLRFWNNEWTMQKETVLEMIWQALQNEQRRPLPNPSPIKGEGLKAAASTTPTTTASTSLIPSAPPLPSPLVGEGPGERGQ